MRGSEDIEEINDLQQMRIDRLFGKQEYKKPEISKADRIMNSIVRLYAVPHLLQQRKK